MNGLSNYLHTIWQVYRKDLQVEWRGRQGLRVQLNHRLKGDILAFNFSITRLNLVAIKIIQFHRLL